MAIRQNIKAALFDFDGTLFYMNVDWGRVKADLDKIGAKDINTISSLPRHIKDRALEILETAEKEGIEKGKIAHGALEVLNRLSKTHKLAVISRNIHQTLRSGIEKIGYKGEIVVIGRDDVAKLKPDPEGVSAALFKLSVQPEEAVYVGDTTHDVEAAKIAGMHSIIVDNPHNAFRPENADEYIASLSDLIDNTIK